MIVLIVTAQLLYEFTSRFNIVQRWYGTGDYNQITV